ncbi:MAG: rhomboid family intramembrane serine protease [Acidobacteriia bacterium]|nr:rhomboid family intramembrane serine protease [Terriglobia bacterium]
MPKCLKCGAELVVNEEGVAPVLCDRCAGRATSRARSMLTTGTLRDYPATCILLAINLAVYVAMVVSGVGMFSPSGLALIRWGGNFGPLTTGGEYWRLVTAGFLHSGLIHIGMNMWALWFLGPLSERLFGKWQTFLIYMLTGVGGALLSIGYAPDRLEVGASGALFGIAGAIVAGLKFGELPVREKQRRSLLGSVGLFIVFSLVMGMNSPNTDNMCHLGGFVTGLIIGLPLGAFARNHKLLQLATILVTAGILVAAGHELSVRNGGQGRLYRAELAFQERNYPKAIEILEADVAARPDDDEAMVLLGDAYMMLHQQNKAISLYQQALKVNPNSKDAQQALKELQDESLQQEDSPAKK